MTLSSPLALALLALGVPIVWFFLRRPPAPLRAVSSLLLARAMARVPRRRKQLAREEILPLVLMLLALLVGAGVLALTATAPRDHLVIVVDDSDDSPLENAPGLARATVAALLSDHTPARTTVVATAPPRLVFAGVTEEEAVLAAVDLPPGTAAGDPTALVAALCRPPDDSTAIVALTHLPLDSLPEDCPVLRPALPPPAAHRVLELTASSPSGTGDAWMHARVVTTADTEWTVFADEQALGTLQATPDETGEAELIARVTSAPGTRLRLVPSAEASAVSAVDLPDLPRVRTLVRTHRPDGYLARLVRLHPRVSALVLPPGAAAPSSPVELVLTDAAEPVTDDARVVVVLGRGAPELGVPEAGRLRTPTLLPGSDPDAALLKLVGLETLRATEATLLEASADATVLATTARGPVAVVRPVDEDTLGVVLGVGLETSDLPLRTAFVHLVANLVDAAAPPPDPPAPAPRRPLVVAAASALPKLELSTPWWRLLVGLVALLLVGEALVVLRLERQA